MKRIFLGVILSFFAMVQSFALLIDGMYYDITSDTTCQVSWMIDGKYSGNIIIPETISYKGVTYKVTGIRADAFNGCEGLTSVSIPNSVTTIGDGAFSCCFNLSSINIPNSVTSIGEWAFSGCSSLTSAIIPNSVTKIGIYTFFQCHNLTSITFGNSVKSIGKHVFDLCEKLQTIKVYMNRPISVETGEQGPFYGIDKSKCVLYVPKGTSMMFMSSPGWMEFENILEFSDEETAVKSAMFNNNIKVFASGKTIIVKGAESDAPVMVKGSNGVLLKSATGNAMIPMENEGIYIVIVGQQTFKVLL